jgi:hypothetical protein
MCGKNNHKTPSPIKMQCGKQNHNPKSNDTLGKVLEELRKTSKSDLKNKHPPPVINKQYFRDIIEGSQLILEDLKKISNPSQIGLKKIKLLNQQILDTQLELWMFVVNRI